MKTPGLLALTAALFAAAPLTAQDSTASKAPEKAKAPKKVDISKLKFMSGCWGGSLGSDKDKVDVEEFWSTPSENLLLSTTRYLKKGRATGFEFSRIEVTDSGAVVFAARSSGEAVEDVYTMKTLVDDYVLFENPTKKKFPQRIMYRMATDGALIPRNEGEGPSVEIRFRRIKCPGADIKLRPDNY